MASVHDLSRYFKNLPTSGYTKHDVSESDEKVYKSHDFHPGILEKYCKLAAQAYNESLTKDIDCKVYLEEKIGKMINWLPKDKADSYFLYEYMIYKIKENITPRLKQLGFPEANYKGGTSHIIIYTGDWVRDNSMLCKFQFMLRDFKYKDYFTYEWANGEELMVILKNNISDQLQRTIIMDLLNYLYYIVNNDKKLKADYINVQEEFIKFHKIEGFDDPIILIICALITTIGKQSGFQTMQSNLDWNEKDINFSFSLISKTTVTAETYSSGFENEKLRNKIFNILIKSKVWPNLLVSFDNNSNYVLNDQLSLSEIDRTGDNNSIFKNWLKLYKYLM